MKIKIIHNVSQYIYAILMGEVFLIPIQIVPQKKNIRKKAFIKIETSEQKKLF